VTFQLIVEMVGFGIAGYYGHAYYSLRREYTKLQRRVPKNDDTAIR
jgi:hypothetical protein